MSMLKLLNIQDKNFKDVLTLDEVLRGCIDLSDITSIYGAYAFVTSGGFDLMFNEIAQQKKVKNINLIIGVDSITNTRCIEHLKAVDHKLFNIKAYIQTTGGGIFHPKFCILANEDHSQGWLILGSNNLTMSAIRKNQEAYTAVSLSSTNLIETIYTWNNWLEVAHHNLKPLHDETVALRARINDRMFRRFSIGAELRKRARSRNKDGAEGPYNHPQKRNFTKNEGFDGWFFNADSEVLIAEIPKSGNRWKQANFNKDTYLNYFEASLETSARQVILRHVNPVTTNLESIEYRPCVAVSSQNYRIELSAAAGLAYPENGDPIAIFINVGKRTFIYSLFMPEHDYYQTLKAWVDDNWIKKGGSTQRKCRLTFPFHEHRDLIEPTTLFEYFEDETSMRFGSLSSTLFNL
ncbi:phospholipase D family protein [Psychrobacter sp. DM4]|uniref:phospholipase D family protein n=1 Tax=Psychrobacter sp. DM4 TaxID=3440637 RepID=UPI003F5079CF